MIPRIGISGEDVGDDAPESSLDVNPETARLFWASIMLANVGLAGLTVGSMLVHFRDDTFFSGGLSLFGTVVLIRARSIYRRFKREGWRDDNDDDNNGDGTDDDDSIESDDASGTSDEREDAPEHNR